MGKQIIRTKYRIELGHPYRSCGVVKVVLGLILLALSAGFLLASLDEVRVFLSNGFETAAFAGPGGAASYGLSLFFSALFGVVAFIMGIRSLIVGIRDCLRIYLPSKVPADIREPKAALESLLKRELVSLAENDSLAGRVLRMLRGDGVDYIPPALRHITMMNAAYLFKHILPVGLIMLVAASREFLAGALNVPGLNIPPPVALVVIVLGIGVVRLVTAVMLVPLEAPDADFERATQELGGAGHPEALLSKLEVVADEFRYMDIPNRIYARDDVQLTGEGVADTGRVQGGTFFETQPVPADDPPRAGGHVLLGSGAILTVLGVLMLANIPSFRGIVTGEQFAFLALPTVLMHIIAGSVALANGTDMLRQSRTVLARFRFRSDLFSVSFGGTYYRSEVGAGMAMNDTLRSKSLAVRTELLVKYNCATVITESVEFNPRDLIAALVDDQLKVRLAKLQDALELQQNVGAKLIGVDFEGNEAVARLASANVAMTAAKAAASAHARSTGQIRSPSQLQVLIAPGSADQADAPASDSASAAGPKSKSEGSASVSSSVDAYVQELEKLAELRDKGVLTDEEFAAKKRKLLGI